MPTIAEIALEREFRPEEISAEDFERCWQTNVQSGKPMSNNVRNCPEN
ncbi:DUF6881 domain-containing protein [Sphingobium sp.]